ncbi:MAG: hypothetical protein SFZ23_00225 [Planctomycetota bacterium]|nr:hypothetical protein [Planctomycetota bacterium]
MAKRVRLAAKDAARTGDAEQGKRAAGDPSEIRGTEIMGSDVEDPGEMPATREELRAWVLRVLAVRIAGEAMIPGHDTPMDYLAHAFFEGGEATAHTPSEVQAAPGAAPTAQPAPEPVEVPVHETPADCVVWANRGGGKTFLGAVASVLDMVYKPGIEIRVLAGSMEQARRMHAHLRRFLALPTLEGLVQGRITDTRVRLRNGSELELLATSQASVRGTRVQKLRCDEVELFKDELWEAAQLVTRSKVCGKVRVRGAVECLSTMHKPYGIMSRVVREARAGQRRLFRWGVADVLAPCGPAHECASGTERECGLWAECRGKAKQRGVDLAGHIEIADALRMKGRVSQATWDAEMLCLRPRRSDLVIPEFEARTHVVDEVPGIEAGLVDGELASRVEADPGLSWVGGMDFGFRGATVILWGVVDPDKRLWIVDERVASETTLAEHAQAIRRGWGDAWQRARSARNAAASAEHERGWPEVDWLGVDPAGKQANIESGRSAVETLRGHGIKVKFRRAKVEEGLGLVRARLRPAGSGWKAGGTLEEEDEGGNAASPQARPGPRLFIHRRCEKLIRSLEEYHYARDDTYSLKPEKDGSDHAVDALRYLVLNLDRRGKAEFRKYA